MTILAVSISAGTPEQTRSQIDLAVQEGAGAVELRTDFLQAPDPSAVAELVHFAHTKKTAVIVTCRDRAQGGVCDWPTEKRIDILEAALDAGAQFVDCEFSHYVRDSVQSRLHSALQRNPKASLILSVHDFSGPFEDLVGRYDSIVTVCPQAIPKLVYTARHINDCFEGLDLLQDTDRDAIVLAMGEAGMISRILAAKAGGFLTFACLSREEATAPGQVPVERMKKLYRWDQINDQTELYGIVGSPVSHSLSPAIYNGCFEAAGLNALYLPFLLEGGQTEFESFMHHVLRRPWLHVGGLSVTIPHKTHALDFAHREGNFVDSLPESIGAVNTLKIGFNGIVSGYNTDCAGAIDALTETLGISRHDLHNLKTAVIGAGGAARAVTAGLAEAGSRVTIYNRTLSKAQSLAREFRCKAAALDEVKNTEAEILINCTSIGMHPKTDSSPVPPEVWGPGKIAFDTVYNPLRTRFLQEAEAAGARIVTGAEMFIRQALAQYRYLVGSDPDEKLIRRIVLDCLTKD
jgi:3-dehydroquinate dehydratase/shikimate dehydrogenase